MNTFTLIVALFVFVVVVLGVCAVMICRQRYDESHRGKWK